MCKAFFCFKVPIIFYKTQQGLLALWFYIRYDSIMMPTKEQAMALLESGFLKNPGKWKNHSIITAKCAYKVASRCPHLNAEKAYIFGLLHDIGRQDGVSCFAHIIRGYDFLIALQYDEAAQICITHSFPIENIEHYIGERDVSDSDLKRTAELLQVFTYTDYDRLIQLCDSLALPDHSTDIITRMTDVKTRYGVYPQEKWNKNLELKSYFERITQLDMDNLDIHL